MGTALQACTTTYCTCYRDAWEWLLLADNLGCVCAEAMLPLKAAVTVGEEVSASGQDRKRLRQEGSQPDQAAPSSDQPSGGDDKTTHIGGPTTTLRASGGTTAPLYKRPKPRGRAAAADDAEKG